MTPPRYSARRRAPLATPEPAPVPLIQAPAPMPQQAHPLPPHWVLRALLAELSTPAAQM
eukprot:CAMPEP_0173185974 /NCGR_PEP_ID=MMETSP1141-20130122/9869_1 /TAXON_ID=483371 /ORGANISM="non described non described, Strain CCMP2298" /LENGTH=58 /DNA_ID=CAMNT_0014109595 /DNA_START=502 /DNA_END=675 /DNA_ORIENTATION=+